MTPELAFKNNLEYLEDSIQIVRLRIHRLKLRRRLHDQDADGDPIPTHRSSRRGDNESESPTKLRCRRAKVNRELEESIILHAQRVAATREMGIELPLEAIVELHHLDEFEKMTIALALAPSIDPSFGNELCSVSRGGRTPEIRDVIEILCDSLVEKIPASRKFTHDSALVANNLIELSRSPCSKLSESDFLQMDVELTQRIATRLLGEYVVDSEIFTDRRANRCMPTLPTALKKQYVEYMRVYNEWKAAK